MMAGEPLDQRRMVLGKYFRIDAAIFLASMIGAFTLCGYAHLEKFYLTLGVSPSRINISPQQFVAYGAANFGSIVTSIAFAIALVGLITLIVVLLERPTTAVPGPGRPIAWVARARDNVIKHRACFAAVAIIGLLALSLFLASQLLIQMPSKSGRASALRFVAECTERRAIYTNLDEFKGCQAGESDDMLYLVQRLQATSDGVEFRAYELPKAGLKAIVSEPRHFSWRDKAN
ncbi:hypothetical protein [Pseudomonas sp. NPDC089401]|uniref:hypothetical protein n=1 Tax=Pseudomonas sp. NPDC089401 TaxID=3364462 RepID=UPI00380EF60D